MLVILTITTDGTEVNVASAGLDTQGARALLPALLQVQAQLYQLAFERPTEAQQNTTPAGASGLDDPAGR